MRFEKRCSPVLYSVNAFARLLDGLGLDRAEMHKRPGDTVDEDTRAIFVLPGEFFSAEFKVPRYLGPHRFDGVIGFISHEPKDRQK